MKNMQMNFLETLDFLKLLQKANFVYYFRPFDIYGLGIEEAKTTSEEYEDRVRFFAEECDYLAGFQVLINFIFTESVLIATSPSKSCRMGVFAFSI